ncbi:hypothetical protein PHAVU_006G114400 [Phaseolus vulgaris]|uniref:Uncharacterized protein n=1 Tax=Phaseolus vulgaris TaxID=3885 RepID=V7BQJ2_PHAVU|nr:hypothetical protein PHAVU_006G114400g [Phaseolus vulgaris]ESW19320.1 hypothetical protein PHAVU_006G114400g [Phaseolus vulgaris]
MGFEEQKKIGKLALFTIPRMESPERSGMATPPLHTSAAVPFRWEEEPGKPRPCSALIPFSNPIDFVPKCLELPPRLLIPSPYVSTVNTFRSPSFTTTSNCYGSDTKVLGAMVLAKAGGFKDSLWFASWKKKPFKLKKREVTGASHVFPSSSSTDIKDTDTIPSIKRSGVWTSICERLKLAVGGRSKKVKKDGSGGGLNP